MTCFAPAVKNLDGGAALPQRAGGLRAPERPAVPDYIPTPSIGTGGDKR